ncbi:MAG TPA: glycosyltransferase family 1 protein [Ectothiorhodospiraceae bacterium]|nr:glycosyltransferase family 1 protein [Ectothiorhodospiraceae bacterium]
MKVVIAGPYPKNVEKIRGGVEAVVVNLTEGLQHFTDLDLHVVTLQGGIQQERTVSSDRLTIHYLPRASRLSYLTFYVNRQRIKKKITNIAPNIIHAQAAGVYAEAAFQTNCPTIVTLHGIIHREVKTYRSTFSRLYKGWCRVRREQSCVKNARHIIAISPYILEEFENLISADTYLIENPIADKFFTLEDRSQPDQILFAGLIIPRKQVLELLQAMVEVRRSVPTVQLRLAGDQRSTIDRGPYFAELQELIAEECLGKNLRFLGSLSEDELLKEYAECSLLILPSVQETAPMVIMQAMAAGKAVVATRVGGIPHLVEDGRTGLLVDSGDVPALAEAIVRLLKNDTLRTAMGQKGREVAERRFGAKAIAEKTREVYYRVAGCAVPVSSSKNCVDGGELKK